MPGVTVPLINRSVFLEFLLSICQINHVKTSIMNSRVITSTVVNVGNARCDRGIKCRTLISSTNPANSCRRSDGYFRNTVYVNPSNTYEGV